MAIRVNPSDIFSRKKEMNSNGLLERMNECKRQLDQLEKESNLEVDEGRKTELKHQFIQTLSQYTQMVNQYKQETRPLANAKPPPPPPQAPSQASQQAPLRPMTRQTLQKMPQAYGMRAPYAANGHAKVMEKKQFRDLVGDIIGQDGMTMEAEYMLMEIADEFIESVTTFACQLAKHRKSDRLQVQDVQLHLERNYNIHMPGYSVEDVRSLRKPVNTMTAAHLQRLKLIAEVKGAVRKSD
jgi:histone H3/H4